MMNIVLATDNNYVAHTGTLIESIGENNKDASQICIYIFNDRISEENIECLETICEKHRNLHLKFIEMNEDIIKRKLGAENIWNDRSLATYSRIFIPEYIEGDRALYLDVDGVATSSLGNFYNEEIKNVAICGVQDIVSCKTMEYLNLNANDVFINAGVILWNLEVCRSIDFVNKCKEFLRERNYDVKGMDQSTINAVLSKEHMIKPVHPRNNVMTPFFKLSNKQILKLTGLNSYYEQGAIEDAINNPVFIHYTPGNTTRPWVQHCRNPKKDEYKKYRLRTPFKDFELQKDNRTLKMKVISFVYNYLPFSIYILMLRMAKR